MIRVASAAYPLDWFENWEQFETKLINWVEEAVSNGAKLLVFPEYGALELASLGGVSVTDDLEATIRTVSNYMPQVDRLHQRLAEKHQVYICGATASVFSDPDRRPTNRAKLFSPAGKTGIQDKLIMTRFEREEWDIAPGDTVQIHETALGRIGIVICYDSEFPLIARSMAEAGAEILLVPSVTETFAGYTRVRTGCMARALENQCVVIHAPLVGEAPWTEAADISVGAAAVYGPSDKGFPENGVLAMGALNRPGWVYADFSLEQIEQVRSSGTVLNHAHWKEQDGRLGRINNTRLT